MYEESPIEKKRRLARDWARQWRAKNPELAREKDKLKNRARRAGPAAEYLRSYNRARYQVNKEKVRAREKAAYDSNRNGRRDKALAYHREKYANRNVLYRVRAAYGAAKGRAKKRGIPFSLTLAELGSPTCCAVTGIEFDMSCSFRQGNIFVPSLDRINPLLGYVSGNVRFVCHGYNLAKHTATDSDVLKLARALVRMFPE